MDVALSSFADKPAVVFASRVDLAIAKAAHSRHGTQSQAFFFTGNEAVVVGPSHTHASVGTATWLHTISPAHTKLTRLTGSAKLRPTQTRRQLESRGEAQLQFPVKEGQKVLLLLLSVHT